LNNRSITRKEINMEKEERLNLWKGVVQATFLLLCIAGWLLVLFGSPNHISFTRKVGNSMGLDLTPIGVTVKVNKQPTASGTAVPKVETIFEKDDTETCVDIKDFETGSILMVGYEHIHEVQGVEMPGAWKRVLNKHKLSDRRRCAILKKLGYDATRNQASQSIDLVRSWTHGMFQTALMVESETSGVCAPGNH